MLAANVRFAPFCHLMIMRSGRSHEPQPSSTLTEDSFAREWLDAWKSHDIDRILTYYTEDAFHEDVPIVENRRVAPSRGREMIREFLVPMFEEMPDLGFD